MALPKLFQRIFWHNNTNPDINEDNLNAMSKGLSDVDDRLIGLAGTIMEDVPQIIADMEILGPAVENIDENVARAEAAAESAEQYAEEIAPPIEVVKDFAEIITLEDAINKAAKDVKLKVEPVQDLHGYTKPWVGGTGKNKMFFTVASIKAANTGGTWNDNVYTIGGLTFTLLTDSGENVTGIKINGTDANTEYFNITKSAGETLPAGNYVLNGGVNTNIRVYDNGDISSAGGDAEFTLSETTAKRWILRVNGGANPNNLIAYPMVRLSGQSNTYESPTNICPITGFTEAKVTRTGKNLLNNQASTSTVQGIKYTVNSDKSITIANTATAQSVLILSANDNSLPAGTYIYSKGSTNENVYCNINAKKNNAFVRNIVSFYAVSEQSFTLDYNGYDRIDILIYVPSGKAPNTTIYPMIRSATIADATYEAYTGTTYTIDLDGTRYGGTLDVTSGVLTLTHGFCTLKGNEGITWSITNTATVEVMYANLVGILPGVKTTGRYQTTTLFNMFKTRAFGVDPVVGDAWIDSNTTVNVCFAFPLGTFNDSAAFNTWLVSNNIQFTYELATPTTVQLTPTEVELLLGYNTLWADTGDLSLTYDASGVLRIANAKLDIDTFKSVVAASSDFADFKTRVAAL